MRTPQIVLTIGRNAPAIAIPGVSQIRGVLIDNPSGAWLLLRPSNDYIPPYTIGFARSFDGAMSSISIEFPSSGPAGQVTTFAGDAPIVVLDSEPVGNNAGVSGGTPFVERFTPVASSFTQHFITTLSTYDSAILNAVNGKRYRVLSAFVALQPFFSVPPTGYDSGVSYGTYVGVTGEEFATGKLSPANRTAQHLFPEGLDLPVGGTNGFGVGSIRLYGQADFADTSLSLTLTYQLI